METTASTSTRPLRSFLLVSDLIPKQLAGGMRFLAELARTSTARGIRMGMMLAGDPIPEVADAFRAGGMTWWVIKDWKTPDEKENRGAFLKGFRRIASLEPWDVIAFEHCGPVSVFLGCTMARAIDGRRFGSVWHQQQGIPSPKGVKKYVSTLRLLNPAMDAFVAVSELAAHSFRERRCSPEKIRIVPNGVRVPDLKRTGWLHAKLGIPPASRLMVTAASLIPRKAQDVLLKSFVPVFKERPDVHLVIAGGGPLMGDLQALAKTLGVDSRVHFMGICNNVLEIMAESDLFVLPSRNEALPVSIVEAMALGMPVVATDVGYVSNVVMNGKTGLLVAKDDVSGLTAAMHSVLKDPAMAAALGKAGQELARSTFSLEHQVNGFLKTYQGVCR